MRFDDLDARMRRFETAHDHCVLPGIFMVARLDGRNFTRLAREVHRFEAPFDERLRDHMVAAASHLMRECGLKTAYGNTHSDEISLLLHRDETLFDRKLRKLISVLAGEASAVFSIRLGAPACFDCRVSQLPATQDVIDYFRWRQEDAHRNALNAHCYWMLRHQGETARGATRRLQGMGTAAKNELLFRNGANYDDLPAWQKRGVGLIWREVEKQGRNPLTGEVTVATRRRLAVEMELPRGAPYATLLAGLLDEAPK